MKKILMTAVMMGLVSSAAYAAPQMPQMTPAMQQMMQKMQNMTPQEQQKFMQNMQQQAMKMQKCVNESGGVGAMQAKAKDMQTHLKELCDAGKRDEAQSYAMEKGKEFASDPQVKKMQECSKDMVNSMPMMKAAVASQLQSAQQKNICDMQKQMEAPK